MTQDNPGTELAEKDLTAAVLTAAILTVAREQGWNTVAGYRVDGDEITLWDPHGRQAKKKIKPGSKKIKPQSSLRKR